MAIYQEAKIKIINTKLNKWKFAAQNKAETILRVNKKYFEDEKEVFLTTRQTINTDLEGIFRDMFFVLTTKKVLHTMCLESGFCIVPNML